LITRANFKTDENSQVLDVVKYIEQYLEVYDDIFDENELIIQCITNDSSFLKRLSALDIALVFDDLISNSRKAGAKKVIVEFDSSLDNELRILISDDGKGVINRFIENPKAMFELGVSEGTLDGSGIGLHSVKKTLKPMQADINFIGNKIQLKGASFEIRIKK
jgi:signal transduction histidine kinase